MKQNVKNIKGIEFVCMYCQTSISFVFETHKAFLNECPNCGADISLICDDIEIK